ncbi:PD40 domain-containing protein [Candidatus Poribacteria bacterium]|nr:PD40 domain-containing protein [Candidatus Poribacteria bacterium]
MVRSFLGRGPFLAAMFLLSISMAYALSLPDIRIVFLSADSNANENIYLLRDLREGSPINLTKEENLKRLFPPRWSPDGRRIVFSLIRGVLILSREIYTLDLRTGKRELIANGLWPAWSPDGSKIAFSDLEGIHVMDLSRGGEKHLLVERDAVKGNMGYLDWSPNGKKIAFGWKKLYVLDLPTGRVKEVPLEVVPYLIEGISWSPDGEWLACGFKMKFSNFPDIYLVDPDTGKCRNLTNSRSIDINPCWTPDGRFILFTSDRNESEDLFDFYLMTPQGEVVHQIKLGGVQQNADVFDPHYAYSVSPVNLWDTMWGVIKRFTR